MIDDYTRLPAAERVEPWPAARAGVVADLDAERIGRAAVVLGAGRHRTDADVDPGVGIEIVAPIGTPVAAGDPVLRLSMDDATPLEAVRELLSGAVTIADNAPAPLPLVLEVIDNRP